MFKATITLKVSDGIQKSEIIKDSIYEIALEIEDTYDEKQITEIHITREA